MHATSKFVDQEMKYFEKKFFKGSKTRVEQPKLQAMAGVVCRAIKFGGCVRQKKWTGPDLKS